MTDLILTVQGTARAELDPERATLRFTVTADGPDREPVVKAVTASLAAARELMGSRHGAGSIVSWSIDQLSVTSHRPWTNDGTQAPLVHQASASGRAVLETADSAAELVDALAADSAVTIDSFEWSLTDASLARAHADARTLAVADAVSKAHVLATAVGRAGVDAVALADPGMLDGSSGGVGPQPRLERAMAMSMDARNPGGFSLRPQPLIIDVAVDARFVAR